MNEKLPTPEKRNLLLSGARALIESLDRDEAEYALLERLWGTNTRQAARIIAEEFVARFGEISGAVDVLTKRLSPLDRAEKWGELEERMSKLCWTDNFEWSTRNINNQPDEPEEELFFLRVMNVISALPKELDYRPAENKAGKKIDYGTPREITDNFAICALCWRSVPRLNRRKKIYLCHLHDIPSTSPEYRRQKALQKYVADIVRKLRIYVLNPRMAEYDMGYHSARYVWALCVDTNSPLPYLVNYLQSLNLPLDSVENVVRALEHPVYLDKFAEPVRQAWEFYFDDRGAYLERHFPQVLLAEAWLRADAEHRRGGKR